MYREVDGLRDYILIVRRRFWTVFLTALVVVGAVAAYSMLRAPVYRSVAEVLVEETSVSGQAKPQSALQPGEMETQKHLITAQPVTKRVLDELQLGMSSEELTAEHVSVEVVPETQVLRISASAERPQLAADIANSYAKFYLKYRQSQVPTPGKKKNRAVGGGDVIQNAEPNDEPVAPKPLRNGGVGLALGVLLGLGLAFLRDHFDDTVHDQHTLRAVLDGRPLLGTTPRQGKGRVDPSAMALRGTDEVAGDAYQQLRANVRSALGTVARRQEGHRPPTILVTSAGANEGKTATAIHLSIAAARVGLRVALVDGNLRHPSVAGRLGLGDREGLSELVRSGASLDAYMVDVGVRNLLVLPSGQLRGAPTEVLAAPGVPHMLNGLAGRFDLVVVDSAPVLGTADTLELATHVKEAVLVARVGRSQGRDIETATGQLAHVGATVLGGVCHGVPRRRIRH